ncbi:MAG TPA: sulfite exporter TauE/SafE family protein [Terriglobia bacterium]|nr:sulfite exporter TauE/SafE family protein [Terriglobia bacterium]
MIKNLFLVALATVTVLYLAVWTLVVRQLRRAGESPGGYTLERPKPTLFQLFVGFITNFFDTLGIGSFATTTSLFKFFNLVPDELIPGTLNVGHALPTLVEAAIYITIVQVDMRTLLLMIAASVLGAWLGAGMVARWPRRTIQIWMGIVLLAAAGLMLSKQLNWMPAGGNSFGVDGLRLGLAVVGNFALGALMTVGIGLYAPCMVLVSLLGMNERTAFPIMMGSCAFLMPVGSVRFIRTNRYSMRAALGLALGGIPGVLVAAYIVKELSLGKIRWLVIAVVVYTAARMLQSAGRKVGGRQ